MEIVRVIPFCIFPGLVSAGQVLLIDLDCLLIPFYRFVVLPNPHINVGGHMDEMTGSRHQARQPLRTGKARSGYDDASTACR